VINSFISILLALSNIQNGAKDGAIGNRLALKQLSRNRGFVSDLMTLRMHWILAAFGYSQGTAISSFELVTVQWKINALHGISRKIRLIWVAQCKT
jgi:hypothetical protein